MRAKKEFVYPNWPLIFGSLFKISCFPRGNHLDFFGLGRVGGLAWLGGSARSPPPLYCSNPLVCHMSTFHGVSKGKTRPQCPFFNLQVEVCYGECRTE